MRDRQRSGRPWEYDEQEHGPIFGVAHTHPQSLGLAYGYWSLERLVEYVNVELGIAIGRSQLHRVLPAEGLHWYQEKHTSLNDLIQNLPKKGAVIALCQQPPSHTHVIFIDEMVPLGVRTYATTQWATAGQRPHIAPDYGGHDSKLWDFGALGPATGRVTTHADVQRTRHEFIAFLDKVVQLWPVGILVLILDNLSVHKTLDVQLYALAHSRVRFLFQPTYSPWLNLIEPW